MRSPKRTSGSETSAWAVPWSTRAVILLAFAIQLMPVSERLTHPGLRPADRLVLSDGRLVALWLTDRAAQQAAAAPAPTTGRDTPLARTPAISAGLMDGARDGLAHRACGLLPLPPPAIA